MLDISFIISCVWLQSINRGFTPHSCIIYNITYPFHNPTFSRSIPRNSTFFRVDRVIHKQMGEGNGGTSCRARGKASQQETKAGRTEKAVRRVAGRTEAKSEARAEQQGRQNEMLLDCLKSVTGSLSWIADAAGV